jgi:outer membrane receptor protein involved in Fe transport
MITAWAKNLSDKTYYDGGLGEAQNLGIANKSFEPPRLYGTDVRYAF